MTVIAPAVGVTLRASPSQANHGAPVTLTATVAGLNPTGTVTFADSTSGQQLGSAPISASVATFTTSALQPGNRSIVANYSGDAANAPRASAPVTVTIGKATSTVAITTSAAKVVHATPFTLTATITGLNPGGTVTFQSYRTFSTLGTVNVTNGKAELTLPAPRSARTTSSRTIRATPTTMPQLQAPLL